MKNWSLKWMKKQAVRFGLSIEYVELRREKIQ